MKTYVKHRKLIFSFFLTCILSSCSSTKKGTYCEFPVSPVDLKGLANNSELSKPIFINDLNGEQYNVVFDDTTLRSWPDSCVNKQLLVHGYSYLENERMLLRETTFRIVK